jgi:hypothetical protein
MMKPSTTQPTRSETPSAQELVHREGRPMFLAKPESFTTVTGLDTNLAEVYDQNTGNLRAQQEGFHAARKPGETLLNYQEVRVRQLHQTLERYLSPIPQKDD